MPAVNVEGETYDYGLILNGVFSLRVGLAVELAGLIIALVTDLGVASYGVWLARRYREVALSFMVPSVVVDGVFTLLFYYFSYLGFGRLCKVYARAEDLFCLMEKVSAAMMIWAAASTTLFSLILNSTRVKTTYAGVPVPPGFVVGGILLGLVSLSVMAAHYYSLGRIGELLEVERPQMGAKVGYAYLLFEFLSTVFGIFSAIPLILFIAAFYLLYNGLKTAEESVERLKFWAEYQGGHV